MTAIWAVWFLIFIASFGLFEGYALKTGKKTLSEVVWHLAKAWPPFIYLFGMVCGALAAHFFWTGVGCHIT